MKALKIRGIVQSASRRLSYDKWGLTFRELHCLSYIYWTEQYFWQITIYEQKKATKIMFKSRYLSKSKINFMCERERLGWWQRSLLIIKSSFQNYDINGLECMSTLKYILFLGSSIAIILYKITIWNYHREVRGDLIFTCRWVVVVVMMMKMNTMVLFMLLV